MKTLTLSYLKKYLILIVLVAGFTLPSILHGQSLDPKFQAVFIYGVSRKIEWTGSGSTFKIAVVGGSKTLVSELKKLAMAKTLNNKSVVVSPLSKVPTDQSYDIVFVAANDQGLLTQALQKAGSGTLVASAYPSGLTDGSHLNFILKGNKITFELNKTAIGNTSLKISDELIALASLVK